MAQDMNREETLNRLEEKAGDYEELFGSCSQGTLLALQETFNLGNAQVLKAATAMPGIALRGETCGAVIGAMMALGLAFGRETPEDWAAVQQTTGACRKLCHNFEALFGSCNCRDVQHHIFGRSYELTDAKDRKAFADANAIKKCRLPAGKAARIAGELILDGSDEKNAPRKME
jgi:C_GCAxxG_C_C family probable redox protein